MGSSYSSALDDIQTLSRDRQSLMSDLARGSAHPPSEGTFYFCYGDLAPAYTSSLEEAKAYVRDAASHRSVGAMLNKWNVETRSEEIRGALVTSLYERDATSWSPWQCRRIAQYVIQPASEMARLSASADDSERKQILFKLNCLGAAYNDSAIPSHSMETPLDVLHRDYKAAISRLSEQRRKNRADVTSAQGPRTSAANKENIISSATNTDAHPLPGLSEHEAVPDN